MALTDGEYEAMREDALRRLARGLDIPYGFLIACNHGWWPLRRWLLPRKYRCLFCGETTRRPWR